MVNLASTSTVLVNPNLLELERLDNIFFEWKYFNESGPGGAVAGIDVNNLILVDSSAAGYYDSDGAFASPVGNR